MKVSITTRLSLLSLATVALVVACDKVPLTSPTGSTISLTADKSILPVNGQATITAIVTESSGTAVHNGTVVSFNPTMGRTDPPEAKTVNGRASVIFIAPSVSGSATINAYSGGAATTSGNSSAGGITIQIGSAAVGSISIVNVTPSSVPQAGGSVTVTALVLDAANNPLPGVAVLFSTDTGTISNPAPTTDSNGLAVTTLTTSRTARITARVADKSGEFLVNVSVAPSVTIEAVGTTHVVGVPVAFTVRPQGGSGNSSPNQLEAVFIEFGDGGTQTINRPTGNTGVTHTYNRADGYTVTATATDVTGARGFSSIAIVVSRLLPVVTITANPATDVDAGDTVAFTIAANPASGGPPIESVRATVNGQEVHTSTGSSAFAYKFTTAGTYIVAVTATDSAGSVGRASTAVIVE